ncbi:hypothetical protein [Streptomyces sp. NPDC047028]|uniref:hypothetical protein n=1 Tax=Streptomyces sp. NPDC047028 TaxID=3155793 RepID=UPI00340088CD
MAHPTTAAPAPQPHAHARDTREMVFFGGVYGAVLASSMVAALIEHGHNSASSRRYDALWVLVTALASALAHGYAHYIAERTPQRRWEAVRAVCDEWPLVAVVLPTVFLLAGAGWGWWPATGVESQAFGLNIVILFTLGLIAARGQSRSWPSAIRLGTTDALLGVLVVVANALIK